MKRLLPLAALLASPALAQDAQVYHASATWPVHASDGACTLVQAQPESGSALSVGYDGDEVILTSTAQVESPLPPSGRVPLEIVFLENGNTDYDDGWGSRQFAYVGSDGVYRFSARFAGARNARQILADLADSKWLGLLQDGETIVAYELKGIAASVSRLRDCASQVVAAN